MVNPIVGGRAEITRKDKTAMETAMCQMNALRQKTGVLKRSYLCLDCSYPKNGFVCWSSNFQCLRTRMMVLDGREEEVQAICRINWLNEQIDPFQIYDFRNGSYGFALRTSWFPSSMRILCQSGFNDFAKDHNEPIMQDGRYTHGKPYEWRLVFDTAFREQPGFTQMESELKKDGFHYYSADLDLLEHLSISFRGICMNRLGFSNLVNRALSKQPRYRREF